MARRRFVLLLLVVSVMFTVSVSAASAKIAFEWKIKGAALKVGETREFTASAESNFDLKMNFGGATILLLSSRLKVEPGAKIIGGKPGTSEETVIFEGVTVDALAGCEVGSLPNPAAGIVRTVPLVTVIVEGQKSGEPLVLFQPKEGAAFTNLRFLGASCVFKNVEATFTGNILAAPLPELKEVLTGLLHFEPSQGNTFLLFPGGGTVETAGLVFSGNAATLDGNALVTLVKNEVYGAF